MLRLNFNLLKMENERKYYTIDKYGNEVREMTDEEIIELLEPLVPMTKDQVYAIGLLRVVRYMVSQLEDECLDNRQSEERDP